MIDSVAGIGTEIIHTTLLFSRRLIAKPVVFWDMEDVLENVRLTLEWIVLDVFTLILA